MEKTKIKRKYIEALVRKLQTDWNLDHLIKHLEEQGRTIFDFVEENYEGYTEEQLKYLKKYVEKK